MSHPRRKGNAMKFLLHSRTNLNGCVLIFIDINIVKRQLPTPQKKKLQKTGHVFVKLKIPIDLFNEKFACFSINYICCY